MADFVDSFSVLLIIHSNLNEAIDTTFLFTETLCFVKIKFVNVFGKEMRS